MSYYFVELYTPKQSWLEMPIEKRRVFLESAKSSMDIFANLGVSVLYLGRCDTSVPASCTHPFMTIWCFEDEKVRHELIDGISNAGWYDYFEHTNAVSHADESGLVGAHLERLLNWSESP